MEAHAAGGVCPACALRRVLREDAVEGGRRLGRYRLIELLGEGGMGSVWLAEDPTLDRLVAVKMLPLAGPDTASLRARLEREARAVASLDHPHVVKVFEVGEDDGAFFLAMEYVEGGDLRERLRAGSLEARSAATLVLQAAGAVAHAHGVGVLHRDLKPGNVLLSPEGAPRLADFGLAAPLGAGGDLTLAGQVLGTPAYMAPEVAEGRAVGEAVDVYGLGTVLYELLTGRPPFAGRTTAAILTAVSHHDPVAPRALAPDTDVELETICMKCLEKEPGRRYASATALEADLAAWLDGRPIAARPISNGARAWRWARRHPSTALALVGAGASLLALALVSSLAAWWIGIERDRAEAGEADARDQLRGSLIEQARNSRVALRPGQRVASLVALGQSADIAPSQEARDEAAAALALPELIETETWHLGVERPRRVAFDPTIHWYAIEEEDRPGLELREVGTARLVAALTLDQPISGRPLFSPDGAWIVARFPDAVLRVWSVPSMELVLTLPGKPFPAASGDLRGEDLVFSTDGTRLGMTTAEGGYVVHAVPSGDILWRWDDPRVPRAAAFSPDERWLGLANFRDFTARFEVILLDARTGAFVDRYSGFGSAQNLAWSPDSRDLAISGSNRVDIRTREGGHQLRRFEVVDGPSHALWWTPDRTHVHAWSDRGHFRRWDVESGALAFDWYERIPGGTRFAVEANGRRLATAGDQWRGVIWEWSPSPVRRTLRVAPGGPAFQVIPAPGTLDFSPDERFLLIAGLNRLAVLELATGITVFEESTGEGNVWTTARWGTTSSEIWWSRRDLGLQRLRFTIPASGLWPAPQSELIDPTPGLLVCDFHRPTARLAMADYEHGRFRVIDTRSSNSSDDWEGVGAFEAVFSPDGASVLTSRLDDRVEAGPAMAWRDLASGREQPLPPHSPGGTIRWARTMNRVVAVVGAAAVELWAPGKAEPIAGLPEAFSHSMGTYAISDDGSWVAASSGTALGLLDGGRGELFVRLAEPAGLHGEIREMRFSPSGRFLAAVRRNGTVSLWDLEALFSELEKIGLVAPDEWIQGR